MIDIHPVELLIGLRARNFRVVLDGDLNISPSYELDPDDVLAIRRHKPALVSLLQLEAMDAPEPLDPWGKDSDHPALYTPGEWMERQEALAHWRAWNASVDARPQEVAQRRKQGKAKEVGAAPLLPPPEGD